jgi:hypothetical protein
MFRKWTIAAMWFALGLGFAAPVYWRAASRILHASRRIRANRQPAQVTGGLFPAHSVRIQFR